MMVIHQINPENTHANPLKNPPNMNHKIFPNVLIIKSFQCHSELLPTQLVLAFAQARNGVPFSPFVEVIIMELAFELIRDTRGEKPADKVEVQEAPKITLNRPNKK